MIQIPIAQQTMKQLSYIEKIVENMRKRWLPLFKRAGMMMMTMMLMMMHSTRSILMSIKPWTTLLCILNVFQTNWKIWWGYTPTRTCDFSGIVIKYTFDTVLTKSEFGNFYCVAFIVQLLSSYALLVYSYREPVYVISAVKLC